ncbi:stoned A [Arctopsyche grandis]|uniref:stoned A n=1 Tax=Arctopsyche grandis TaxID=121162 RepID=UPI00406D8B9E
MLKIPKGLKKKKKGKKSKRKGEEELFTEEELEKYKREHQTQPQPQQPEAEFEQASETKPATENDEWSKFNALTTGVDSILKKTQGDLDRIKSTSFFQRVPAGPKPVDRCGKELPFRKDAQKEGQCWVGFEEQKGAPRQPVEKAKPQLEEVTSVPEAVFSESEEEEEDFDDIFDTSYVEAVEKGEVTLAYVPDSPEEEVDAGPDPFDTSYAEKVIKGPEVSKKGKKLVNIGAAVEVLTGRIDHVSTSSAAIKKAKRRIPRDLLLESADSDDLEDVPVEEANVKSLLDDDAGDISGVAVDLSVSLHTQFIQKNTENTENENKNDILDAFDTFGQDDNDEFAQLAAESLNKPVAAETTDIPALTAEPFGVSDGSWSAFEDSKTKPGRPPPPRPSTGPAVHPTAEQITPNPDSPIDFELDGPDPFDTAFAENILPGKAELKQIEDEILNSQPIGLSNSDSDFDFDPRADEKLYINNRRRSSVHIHVTDPTGIRESISGFGNTDTGDLETLKPIHRDLLGGSSTDLSKLADSPIAPVVPVEDDHIEYSDPFDTSIVDFITAPGKTELKFIEKELLGETELKRTLSDPDFDPRAYDSEEIHSSPRKPSRPENLLVNKAVIFSVPSEGDAFLGADKDAKKSKPLTPYYSREASITELETDTQEDLFEASFVETNASTKSVVSILKNKQPSSEIKRSSSNQDLNADEEEDIKGKFTQLRRHSDFPLSFSKPVDTKKTDFLSIAEEDTVDTKVLTPYQEEKDEEDFDIDPFDTSLVSNILLPGKTELKFLENEFLAKDTAADSDFNPRLGENKENSQPQDLLAPSDDAFQVKALTPQQPQPVTGFLIGTEDDDIDPFDTSIADNLGPGKTELRLLESELMN